MRAPTVHLRELRRASFRSGAKLLLPLALLGSSACIDRPVGTGSPTTTNIYVDVLDNRMVDKIDLLFMIDNSASMADKQAFLSEAVPVLTRRLVTPNCLDASGMPTGLRADALGRCAAGKPEFRAIRDIHIGVITSSLGSHGGSACTPQPDDVEAGRTPDDRAELLPSANPAVRGPLPSWNGSGFLAWDPGQDKHVPPGEANLDDLVQAFTTQITKAGELGCGYEASLEAWYRFLIDPEPPISVSKVVTPDNFESLARGPVNEALLAQRRAFLRPDSLVAIVMLTDENDCSVNDENGSQGYFVTDRTRMMRASAACATNPNDRCCHTCLLEAPSGCTPNAEDSECKKGGYLSELEDSTNLRCFAQKQRFGVDFLYPTDRYVKALTEDTVPDRSGALVKNPLFWAPPGVPQREPGLVLLAGIVGVPWQDIATAESLSGPGLEYLTAEELEREGRWELVLGTDGQPPRDPLMRESVEPRSGVSPIVGAPLVPPNSDQPDNPINGHEQAIAERDDLQYACTFTLPEPKPCARGNALCDCEEGRQGYDRPLCEYPDGPDAPGVQIAAKAYPGVRTLEVLRGVKENGIVASICPKQTSPRPGLEPEADPSYGYNPAIASILKTIVERLPSQCLPRPLTVETDPESPEFGHVPCAVVEAMPKTEAACACDGARGRQAIATDNPNLPKAVREQLEAQGLCGGASQRSCRDFCFCEIDELVGAPLRACQDGSLDPNAYGYCYVDPEQGIGNPELVAGCTPTSRRLLRFVGDGLPANGSHTFMACVGKSL